MLLYTLHFWYEYLSLNFIYLNAKNIYLEFVLKTLFLHCRCLFLFQLHYGHSFISDDWKNRLNPRGLSEWMNSKCMESWRRRPISMITPTFMKLISVLLLSVGDIFVPTRILKYLSVWCQTTSSRWLVQINYIH